MLANFPSAESLFIAGNQALAAGELPAAEAAYRQALAIAPELTEVHANLALTLARMARPAEAEAAYRAALALAPAQPQIHLNYGVLLAAQKRYAEAENCYRKTLELDPASITALSNLGVLLVTQKREDEAEACYRSALALEPDAVSPAFNLAYLLLRQGRYEEGWLRFETRRWSAELDRRLGLPRWQGESLAGKAILVGFEMGHGDMIQFCRYLPLLKERGAQRLGLLCHPGLKRLFGCLTEVDVLIGLDEAMPADEWDYWISPLSLPHRFATRLETIPAAVPYLQPATADVAQWTARLPADGSLRVGLVWHGNPGFENDRERSLPSPALLAPLTTLPGVRCFSLQKGASEAALAEASPPQGITDLAPWLEDFADTAAAITHLDLVIGVDTAVVHLAGALGKPCWLLLPDYQTDWRWLAGRDDTPWYPTLRLFRQTQDGDWPAVIARVHTELAALVAGRG